MAREACLPGGARSHSWLRALLVPLLLCVAAPLVAQSLQPIPALETRVTDLTGTLTAGQQSELDQKLAAFEQRKGAQIAVLIVPTTQPEAIEQYSIRVVDAWKLGRAKPDDGVLLLVALKDRAMRIEVGYGFEGAITDALASRIINNTITPLFRQGNFFGGVNAGVDEIIRVINGEALPPPDRAWQGPADRLPGILPFLFVGVLGFGAFLRAIFGRTLGAVATGGATGAVVWLISRVLGDAFKVHINEPGADGVSIHPAEMPFTGTLAGARALDMEDRFGNFDVGKEADFLVIDPAGTPALAGMIDHGVRSADTRMASEQTLFALLMGMREPSVAQVYVRGRRVDGNLNGR